MEEYDRRQEREQAISTELAQSIRQVRDHSKEFKHDWIELAAKKRIDLDPNPPTTHAISFFRAAREKAPNQVKPFAIDLGCGCGLDTRPYLEEGFRVHAIDAFFEIVDNVNSKFAVKYQTTFSAECTTLQYVTFNEQADIVSCVTTFPWIPKKDFPTVWDKVVGAVKLGGLFSFDLYGKNHAWANDTESFFTEAEVFSLIADSGLKIRWQQYYNTETKLVLEDTKPIFEYWEFVCEKSAQQIGSITLEAGMEISNQEEDNEEKLYQSTMTL